MNREERVQKEQKAMQPFIYENLIKGILSKSKYESKSRTYLTHMNAHNKPSMSERPKSPRNNNITGTMSPSKTNSKSP